MTVETLKRLDEAQGQVGKARKQLEDMLEAYIEARMKQLDALRAHNSTD